MPGLTEGDYDIAYTPKSSPAPVQPQPGESLYDATTRDFRQRTPSDDGAHKLYDYNANGQSSFGANLAHRLIFSSSGPEAFTVLRRMGTSRITSWLRLPLSRLAAGAVTGGPPEFVYDFPNPQPRLAAYSCWATIGKDASPAALRKLFSDPPQSSVAVVFTENGARAARRCEASPVIQAITSTTTLHGDQLDFDRASTYPYLAVLQETIAPGWRVYVDGQATTTVEAEAGFVGALIPAGAHHVRFIYEPLLTRWIPVTLAGLAFALGLLVLGGLQRRRSAQAPAAPPSALP